MSFGVMNIRGRVVRTPSRRRTEVDRTFAIALATGDVLNVHVSRFDDKSPPRMGSRIEIRWRSRDDYTVRRIQKP